MKGHMYIRTYVENANSTFTLGEITNLPRQTEGEIGCEMPRNIIVSGWLQL